MLDLTITPKHVGGPQLSHGLHLDPGREVRESCRKYYNTHEPAIESHSEHYSVANSENFIVVVRDKTQNHSS